MVSKTFLLIVLAFATVLLITSDVVAAAGVEVGKFNGPPNQYITTPIGGGSGSGCPYGQCCDYSCRCCASPKEAAAYKQAQDQSPTHN